MIPRSSRYQEEQHATREQPSHQLCLPSNDLTAPPDESNGMQEAYNLDYASCIDSLI
jgi:hypothetical protein